MDFNVNVNVKFDATPALTGVVSTLVGALKPVEVMQPAITAPAVISPREEAKVPVVQEQVQAPMTASDIAGQTAKETADEITDEMLRKFVGPKSKDKGKDAIFEILDEFGVKRVPDLKQEQRQAFIDKVNAL